MSTAIDKADAAANISALATLGNAVATYQGSSGKVAARGYIDDADALALGEVPMSESRYVATLLVEDVGKPSRGDRITDEDGAMWRLVDEIPGIDPHTTDWTCERL